jgi:hypothetical protein
MELLALNHKNAGTGIANATPKTTTRPLPSMPVLPEDVICEILTHCSDWDWRPNERAALCLVQKGAWLKVCILLRLYSRPLAVTRQLTNASHLIIKHARRALYRDLRLRYEFQVERLRSCLSLNSANRSLVQSLELLGSAAALPHIGCFLWSLPSVQRLILFDVCSFQISAHHSVLSPAVAVTSLTSLSLQYVTARCVLQMLKVTSPYLHHLEITGVMEDDLEAWEGWEEWTFPHLTNLELAALDRITSKVLHQALVRTSKQLRRLRFSDDSCPGYFATREHWEGCHFDSLQSLHLTYFDMKIVQHILQQCSIGNLKSLTIHYLDFRTQSAIARMSIDNEADENLYRSFFLGFPNTLEHFEIVFASHPSVLYSLSYRIKERSDWLPRLRKLPVISIHKWQYGKEHLEALKRAAYIGVRSRNLRFTQAEEKTFFATTCYVSS